MRRDKSRFLIAWLVLSSLVMVGTSHGQALRLKIGPSLEYQDWNRDLGLKDELFWGGQLSLSYGRAIDLQGYFHTRPNLDMDFSKVSSELLLGGVPTNREVDASSYGAHARIKLAPGPVSPYLQAGVGILRLDPGIKEASETVTYNLGVGIEFRVGNGLTAQLGVQQTQFELDRLSLADTTEFPASVSDPQKGKNWENFSASFSLAYAWETAGKADKEQGYESWSLASIPLEPFAARVEFSDDKLPNQTFVGLRTGVDLGATVGLRGFFMEGRTSGLGESAPIRLYGGEVQVFLSRVLGPSPYVSVGIGKLDFGRDYRDLQDNARDDKTTLMFGGGIGFNLSDQFRLNAGIRDMVMKTDNIGDARPSNKLDHNWIVSTGITFNLGRGRTHHQPIRPETFEKSASVPASTQDAVGSEAVVRADGTLSDTTGAALGAVSNVGYEQDAASPKAETGFVSDQVISFPVPKEGEVYIRYGKPSDRLSPTTVSTDSVTSAVPLVGLSQMSVDSLVKLVASRLELSLADQWKDQNERLRESLIRELDRRQPSTVIIQPNQPSPSSPAGRDVVVIQSEDGKRTVYQVDSSRMRWKGTSIFTGLGLNRPKQLMLATRGSLGPVAGSNNFLLVPELAFGFGGGGTSTMLTANVEAKLPSFNAGGNKITPHLRLGLGILWLGGAAGDRQSAEGVMNFAWGVSSDLNGAGFLSSLGRPHVFVEHLAIDLFDLNRIVLGLRWQN